jgi:ribonuclease P protein component
MSGDAKSGDTMSDGAGSDGAIPRIGPGRLTRRAEFQAAAKGRRYNTERMTVQGRARDAAAEPGGLRFGFTVTKKTGHATERNRIRRRFRAAAALAGAPHAGICADVVVVGRREALGAPFPILVEDVAKALSHVTRPRSPSSGRNPPPSRSPAPPPPGDTPRRSHDG